MAKNLKKKNKVLGWCLAGALVVAGASALALIDAETNVFTKMFEEEKLSEGKYEVDLSSMITEVSSEKETLKQEVEINDLTSPFEKIELNYQLYGTEKEPATIAKAEDSNALVMDYVSEVEIKFELKEDVEFNVSSLSLLASYIDEENTALFEDRLDIDVKVGGKKLDAYTSSENHVFMADNAVSGDIVVTIKNILAEEGEAATFVVGGIVFNGFDTETWTPKAEEDKTDETTSVAE